MRNVHCLRRIGRSGHDPPPGFRDLGQVAARQGTGRDPAPDIVHGAVRDLTRAREVAMIDLKKKRQQLLLFRHGRI
jgi:hypothetical protein